MTERKEHKSTTKECEVVISRALAHKCAEALIDKHNTIAERGHYSCTVMSYGGLKADLKRLDMEFLIASAIRPNKKV